MISPRFRYAPVFHSHSESGLLSCLHYCYESDLASFFGSFDPFSVDVFAETFFEAFDLGILCLRGFRVALAVVVMRRMCHLADVNHRE